MVGGVVSRVSDRQEVVVRCSTQHIDNFKRRSLLALDAVVVDGVDQVDGVVLGELASDIEAVVKVATDLQHVGVMNHGLAELAHRNLSIGDQDGSGHASIGGIGGSRGRGVAG